MKLLISAYACAPNRGSEHGSAWNWVTEANRLGHQVWVMVSPQHRDSITAAARLDPALQRITWVFPEIRFWPMQQGKEPKRERSYNLLWQKAAVPIAKSLQSEIGFDFVHHLTWGGIRAPTFLGFLGVPLIIGPIGGGETSPKSLRDRMPAKGRILEFLRDLSSATAEISPVTRSGLRSAAVIFARTADTRNLLSPALREKTLIRMEVGVSDDQIGVPRTVLQAPPRLLFAGRLLYWKGVHVAIEAMASLVQKIPGIKLTIVGSGPEEASLKQDVADRKLEANVDFIAWMKQEDFMRLYDTHDMLVFPSFHDSTGWVVLEALCHGLPVACLDLGGPKDIVTPACGVVAATKDLTTSQVAVGLADKIAAVVGSQARWEQLSAGAIARAREFLLSDRLTQLYEDAGRVTGRGQSTHETAQANPAMAAP
jgi:glycosyltransferase involved in cell wall biosynthesis